jgi:hypothetical protein
MLVFSYNKHCLNYQQARYASIIKWFYDQSKTTSEALNTTIQTSLCTNKHSPFDAVLNMNFSDTSLQP